MKIKQIIILTILLITSSISFSQSKVIDKEFIEINDLMKKNGLNDKFFTQLNINDGKLIFENIGKNYKLKNSDKRELTIDKILIKKIKLKSTKRPNKTFTSKIEFKTKGKYIYSETLKGDYSNCYVFFNVKEKEIAEKIKNRIIELIKKLQE